MCDICSDVIELLQRYENEIKKGELRYLFRQEMNTLCAYVQSWMQRQCTCCFKDPKNFDRFNALVQGLALSIIEILQQIARDVKLQKSDQLSLNSGLKTNESKKTTTDNESKDHVLKEKDKNISSNSTEETEKDSLQLKSTQPVKKDTHEEDWSLWTSEDREKILNIFSKVFLLNFPLYMAFKHSMQSKLDDMDIPVYLLRNVCFFCDKGGLKLFIACFQDASPENLPMTLAHAMITVISNLKLWMNIGSIMQHLVPLRSCVIRYLCQVKDSHLRAVGNRNMFEFMWTAVKDPLDAHATFDKEGLDLAFKYFSSTTLTMRLAGISQINSHINMYNELCHNESLVEAENVGNDLANWLISNKIIECIFGPNLHVELIKQSHIILNFLAMEGRITNEHIDAVWSAAQLKHCSRQVLDLLPPLIKNLEVTPVLHLYKLLCSVETKEQTEQTAERALKEVATCQSQVQFMGNAPVGYYKYKYPKAIRGNGICGAKVFFFKAQLQNPKEDSLTIPKTDTVNDYLWLTHSELEDVLVPMLCKTVQSFLFPDSLINENSENLQPTDEDEQVSSSIVNQG